jgi:hypothetical protein
MRHHEVAPLAAPGLDAMEVRVEIVVVDGKEGDVLHEVQERAVRHVLSRVRARQAPRAGATGGSSA